MLPRARTVFLALALAAGASPPAAPAAPAAGSDLLYRAAVAAADASLRLHDTAAAKKWLAAAPEDLRRWEWHYLSRLADPSAAVLAAHDGAVSDVSISPDATRVASASADGTVKVWDVRSRALLATLRGHAGPVGSAVFSPDGTRLATSSTDGTLRLWDLTGGGAGGAGVEGVEVWKVEGVGRGLHVAAWHPGGARLASASWTATRERGVWGVVRVWDAASGARQAAWDWGAKPISTLAFSPDGATLAAGNWDDDVALWAVDRWGEPPVVLTPEKDARYKAVQAVAFSPDGAQLAVGAKDGRVRVWDLRGRRVLHTLTGQAEGQAKWINDVAYTPDGASLLAAGQDGTLRLWDAATGEPRAVWHGHDGAVAAVALARHGRTLVSGANDRTLRFWDLGELGAARTTWPAPDDAYGAAITRDGARVAATGWGGWVRVWDRATGLPRATWTAHGESGVRVAWSGDGQLLVTTGNDGRVVMWTAEGKPVAALAEFPGRSLALATSPDGALVASVSAKGTVSVWRYADAERVATLADAERTPVSLAWTADGARLVLGGTDGLAKIWDWRAGRVAASLTHGSGAVAVAAHPRGSWIATAGNDRNVRNVVLWDARTGSKVRELAGHVDEIHHLVFSPDGARLASVSSDGTLKVWDPATGECLLTIARESQVYHLDWSADGAFLALVPLDRTVVMLEGR